MFQQSHSGPGGVLESHWSLDPIRRWQKLGSDVSEEGLKQR